MDLTLIKDRYRIDEELGRGGMGAVYHGHDLLLDRPVAIKLLAANALSDETRRRLLQEARATARLNHPNIVAVHDAGEQDGVPFIVMELVVGRSLHDTPPADMAELLAVARQIAAALEHAHSQGIIHRDLKPENVIVTAEGTAKLMDFGLARSVATRSSGEGLITGTVFYLAPEQALGEELDGRADLYTLGVMLYELAAGRLPFVGDDPLAIISQHLYAPPVPPRAHNAALPPALEAVIMSLLAKRPADRPATAHELRVALEGIAAAPVDAAAVAAPPTLERIARGQLVGRQRELAAMVGSWRRAAEGEGHLLLISGEPGIGKSRLLRELIAQARVSGGRTLLGECYAEGSAPYEPLAQMLAAALAEPAGIEAQVTLSQPAAILADLAALVPRVAGLLPAVPPDLRLEPAAEQLRIFDSVAAWCAALAGQAPLLLAFEDTHWADSGTLALLRHLARRLPRNRVLIVATYRETELDESRPWQHLLVDLNRERLTTRIKLARLDRQATGDLLSALFDKSITTDFRDGIYEETEGNPFFIEEVCKALVEEGQLFYADGRWHRPAMDQLFIPQSIHMAIQARVGRLPEPAQEVLRVAALVGREFDLPTLLAAAGADEDTVSDALELAERAQIIIEVRGREPVTYTFAHALIPFTLSSGLSGVRRQRLHRRIAAALENVHAGDACALALHYRAGGEVERAGQSYRLAGDHAAAVFAYEEAESAYRSALEVSQGDAGRAYLHEALLLVLTQRSHYEAAIAEGRSAQGYYAAAGDSDGLARVYQEIARTYSMAGNFEGSLAITREGLAATAGETPSAGQACLLAEAVRAMSFTGHHDEARPLGEDGLRMAEDLQLPVVRAEILTTLILDPQRALEDKRRDLEQAVALAHSAGAGTSESRARHNLAGVYSSLGQLPAAHEQYRLAAALTHELRIPAAELYHLANDAWTLTDMGELRQVEVMLPVMAQLRSQLGAPGQSGLMHDFFLAYYHRVRGELDEALRLIEESRAPLRDLRDGYLLPQLDALLADILLEQGRLEQAEEALAEGLPLDERTLGGVMARSMLVLLRVAQHRIDDATLVAGEIDALRSSVRGAGEEELAAFAAASLARADRRWSEALDGYETLAQLLTQRSKRSFLARIRSEWAAALLERNAAGDGKAAAGLLRQSCAAYEEMGIPYYAAPRGAADGCHPLI